jgi:GNAT superfamily N-acetyltransferase
MSEAAKPHPDDFKIRFADKNDSGLILDFIKKLADYEKRLNEVVATKDDICEVFFKRKFAEAIIGEYSGNPVGFAVFFYNFSTFVGRPGIYIEDLYVNPEVRSKGFGTLIFAFIAKLAVERKCGRLEWTVLHWNKPSINFYKKMGAVAKNEWEIYKMDGIALEKLAKKAVKS